MPKRTPIEIRQWLLDYRTDDDLVPLCVSITNWVKFPGQPWGADITVRFDGCPKVSAELAVRCDGRNYIADVRGEGLFEEMESVRFPTFHAAQLAAEEHALHVSHLIPVAEQEPSP